AVSKFSVPGQTLRVVGRFQKLISTPDVVPMQIQEWHIPASGHIVIHSQDEEWSRISGSKRVWEILKPRHERRRLRNFVLHFPVFALVFENELQGSTSRGKITDGIEGKICPKRVSSKEPGKTRPLTESGSAVSSNQATAQERIFH